MNSSTINYQSSTWNYLLQASSFKLQTVFLLLSSLIFHLSASAQDPKILVQKVKAKLHKVNDYVADGRMKTDVAFIKAPAGKVKIYYKKPNKFKLKRDGGISILPKGGVSVNMSSVLATDDFVAIASGEGNIGGTKVKIIKLLPTRENSDVVLTTLYIDEANLLIRKANTTTRENGTYEMELNYGKYSAFGLPDKVVFSFNTKDYKLPKGLTLEFETGEKLDKNKLQNKKGRVEITYSSYIINKGVPDSEFK
jgi:outer membrane lipoprotein-sorting protein